MKTMLTYRFRLRPTAEVEKTLLQHGGTIRYVWNKLVEFANQQKELTGKFPSIRDNYQKHIIAIKDKDAFTKNPHSQPVQITAARIAKTCVDAFSPKTIKERNQKIAIAMSEPDPEKRKKKLAKAERFAFPCFKKKSSCEDSIFYPQNFKTFKICKSRIYFAKIGWISFVQHRTIKGVAKTITIRQDGDQWYASIACEVTIKEKRKKPLDKANIIGIDLGIKDFAVLSDGTTIPGPKTLKKNLKKLKRESKRLSKKTRVDSGKTNHAGKPIMQYSKNGDKQVRVVNRLHRKIRNIRKDFLHKTSHYIISKYDGVVIEDLDIKGMSKQWKKGSKSNRPSKAMNRCISDAALGRFAIYTQYKADNMSRYFTKIDRYYKSTQTCSGCGHVIKMELSVRVYVCPECGLELPRDHNSAIAVRNEGVRLLKEEETELVKHTVATTGIQVCGPAALVAGLKQKQVGHTKLKKFKIVQ